MILPKPIVPGNKANIDPFVSEGVGLDFAHCFILFNSFLFHIYLLHLLSV